MTVEPSSYRSCLFAHVDSCHLLCISWYSHFLLCFSYIIFYQGLLSSMSWKVLFQVFEIDVINAWTVVWHVVSIQTFVDSVDQVMFVDSILSFSLANSKGPCLPLLKPQTINSPFSLSISAPSLYSPSPFYFRILCRDSQASHQCSTDG